MSRLGKHQLHQLILLGSPSQMLLTPDAVTRSLIVRGLLADHDGAVSITAAGLRALADEMESGRVAQWQSERLLARMGAAAE